MAILVTGCGDGGGRNPGGDEDMATGGGQPDLSMSNPPDLKTSGNPDLKMGGSPDLAGGGGGPDLSVIPSTDMSAPANVFIEQEQPNQRTNDSYATAEAVVLGNTVDGTIGDFDQVDGEDLDFYKFNATAGDVIKLTLWARGDYQPHAFISDELGNYSRELTGLGTDTATRQAYVPTTGEYFLVITEQRNYNGSAEVGGTNNTYRLTLEKVTVTPMAVTLPLAAMAGTLGAGNEIKMFSFTATTGQGYAAEVRAGRLTTPSDIDTAIYLIDSTGTPPTVIKFNDDIDAGGANFDSRALGVATNNGSYLVVLDHYSIGGPVKTFELDLKTYVPPMNDTCGMAGTLVSGTTLYDQNTSDFTNNYDAVTPIGPVCALPPGITDYTGKDVAYTLSIPPGQTLTVTVTPDSSFDPGLYIVTDCGAASTSCVAIEDSGLDGDPETVAYTNAGVGARTVFIIVDGYDGISEGSFSILATVN